MADYAGYAEIRADLDAQILTITLNRPAKLNAYTLAMGLELRDAFERASADDDVRAIIVTGEGRGFCSGADMSPEAGFASRAQAYAEAGETRIENRFVDAIFNCHKPSIAAINGPAVGVGITMTLPMDVRIAAATARIGFVFARRGLVLEAGCAWFLPRIVGLAQALRWCYGARIFDAAEALQGGLVSEVVPPEELLPRARAIAREFVDGTSPVSIALTRHLLHASSNESSPLAVLELDSQLNRELGLSNDVRDAILAWSERREPSFNGRPSLDLPAGSPWGKR
jgi:enoyl-CoA hydratase/carnithine racemase